MVSRDEFERALAELAALDPAEASRRAGDPPPSEDDLAAHAELQQAYARLKAGEAAGGGDPAGDFTYEDQVLATAVIACRVGAEQIGTAGRPGEDLRNASVWKWLKTGAKIARANRDLPWQVLGPLVPTKPVRLDKPAVRLAVVGDGGYLGKAQARVVDMICARHAQAPFDAVIHLGDVYFAGSTAEMYKNFVSPFGRVRNAGARLLAVCGNHDLFCHPEGFATVVRDLGQPGRFFAVESQNWRIACLDTALAAAGFLRNAGQLDDKQLEWLTDLVRLDDGKRLVLMSHHYILSAWERNPSPVLADQVRDLVRGAITAWYWGHEHVCATYDRAAYGFDGACVGNGAYLEEWEAPRAGRATPSWHDDGRCTCFGPAGPHYWRHGYLELDLRPDDLVETYHLEGGATHTRRLPDPAPAAGQAAAPPG
ncbi:MAG TPA: metallophosphoesterase [Gemmataceae bacterium]|jgi:3',5'-cyclic AMP phosphodiesterase CpdA